MLKQIRSRSAALLLGFIVLLSAVAAFAPLRAAAAELTYPDAITDIRMSFADDNHGAEAKQWDRFRIDADWSVPDTARGGETFGMTLPPELSRLAQSFDLRNQTGDLLGRCVVSDDASQQIVCTLSDFVDTHDDVRGTLWLEAEARYTTTEHTLRFEAGGAPFDVDIPGDGGIIGNDPAPTSPRKGVSGTTDDGRLNWYLHVPSSMAVDGTLDITDRITEASPENGLENHSLTGELSVYQRGVAADGNYANEPWVEVPADQYELEFPEGKTGKEFRVRILNVAPEPPVVYAVNYRTKPDDGYLIPGDRFANDAVAESTAFTHTEEYREHGGGDGDGTQLARFAVEKALAGPAAPQVPEGTAFTVEYVADGQTHTLSVVPGAANAALSNRFPLNTTVTIREIDLPAVDGLNWESYSLQGEGVVDNGDGSYTITPDTTDPVQLVLTNTVSPAEEPTPTPTPTPTDSPEPTPTDSPEPTPTPTDSPEPTPTDSPEPTPTPTDSSEPTPSPTDSSEPTPTDSPEPTPSASDKPSESPTDQPAPSPSDQPGGDRDDRGGSDRDDRGGSDRDLPRTGATLLPLGIGAILVGLGAAALGLARRSRS